MIRITDLILSTILLTVLSPLMIIVALIVLMTMGRPVLFVQMRPGMNGMPFKMYKFRTMLELKSEQSNDKFSADRISGCGSWLRSFSLDELPNLWNVFRGDMSLVGPRPLRMEYLSLYDERQSRRHEVRPGITGLAQICGRNSLSWEDKFELDVEYVEKKSWLLNIRILVLTLPKIIKREGIYDSNNTIKQFKGSKHG